MTPDPIEPTPLYDEADPIVAGLLRGAYAERVSVETAARHLWVIHGAAARLKARRGLQSQLRHVALSIVALLFVVTSSTAALAGSRNALPGELLYSVKRGAEQAELLLASTPRARAEVHLQHAATRTEEAQLVLLTQPEVARTLLADSRACIHAAAEISGSAAVSEALAMRAKAIRHVALALKSDDSSVVGATTPLPPEETQLTAEPLGTDEATTATDASSASPSTPSPSASDVAAGAPTGTDDPASAAPTFTGSPSEPPAPATGSPTPSPPDSQVLPPPVVSPTPPGSTPQPTPQPSPSPSESSSEASDAPEEPIDEEPTPPSVGGVVGTPGLSPSDPSTPEPSEEPSPDEKASQEPSEQPSTEPPASGSPTTGR